MDLKEVRVGRVSSLDFMMSERLQRILGAVLLLPERETTLADLIRIGGNGRGATQTVVGNLLRAGIVKDRRLGNQRLFTANTSHPLYPELRALTLKTFGLADRVRQALVSLGNGVDLAFIFGSFAKGTDGPDSDIDMMIVGEADLSSVIEALAVAERDLGRSIHANVYNPQEWVQMQRDRVVEKIVMGPKILVVGHERERNAEAANEQSDKYEIPQGRRP